MLKCDFGNLEQEIRKLEDAGASVLHLDVMDGHFVPNLSYGPMVIERIRERTDLVLDAHLMISDPTRYIDEYIQAGCDWITFHIEAVPKPTELLQKIRSEGKKAGITLNPGTPVEALAECVGECDLVLVMSVEPGFGGQSFMPISIEKVAQIRERFGPDTLISIDGGIGPATIQEPAAAGARLFVTGSSIFDHECYATAIEEMQKLATEQIR